MDHNKPGAACPEPPFNVPEELIAGLLRQAWDEALGEARQVLKQRMLQGILDQSEACLPNFFNPVRTPEAPSALPAAPIVPLERETSRPEKQLADEVESIRQKIIENERLLQQIKKPALAAVEPVRDTRAATAPAPGEGDGFYVYGVVGADIPDQDLPQEGIDPAYSLYSISDESTRAIVSRVSLQEYGEEALRINLHNPAWLESKARSHQATLETIAQATAIVPMRFCTIYLSETHVKEMLALHHDDFSKALAYLSGKEEWGVKVFYDRQMLSQQIEENNEDMLALKAGAAGKSSGMAYFTRKKYAETLAEHVERSSDAYAQDSHNRLSACAEATCLLENQTKEAAGRQEEMVLNGAYLIHKEKISAFRAELEKLGHEYGPSGFYYEFTGPWPAYNFVGGDQEGNLADE